MKRIPLVSLCFAAMLLAGLAQAESALLLLEQGIYQEETVGDTTAAMEIYQKIVDDTKSTRTYAAQALLRLGQCQQKIGRGDLANATFDRLLREFPDQTALVEQAAKLRSGCDLQILPAPWKDGEVATLDMISPADVSIGTMIFTTRSSVFENRPVWVLESEMSIPLANQSQTTRVTAERDSFDPILGYTKSILGEFNAVYRPNQVTLTTGANGKETARTIDHAGTVYDNEQALYLIRRLPLAPGYRATIPILPVQGGVVVECQVEVVGTETVETPKGSVLCHKMNLAVVAGGAKQLEHQVWFSADDHRFPIQYDSGVFRMVLRDVEVKTRENTEGMRYTDPTYHYQLWLPPGWSIGTIPVPQAKQAWALQPPRDVKLSAFLTLSDCCDGKKSLREAADDVASKRAAFFADYVVRPDSWTNVPISTETGLSWLVDYTEKGSPMVEYNLSALHGRLRYGFTFRVAREDFATLKPTLDSIVERFQFGKVRE